MNIDKVNATLGKALSHIQLAESEDLQDLLASKNVSTFDRFVLDMAEAVAKECKIKPDDAIEAIVEAAGVLADNGQLPEIFGIDKPTDDQAKAWMEAAVRLNLPAVVVEGVNKG